MSDVVLSVLSASGSKSKMVQALLAKQTSHDDVIKTQPKQPVVGDKVDNKGSKESASGPGVVAVNNIVFTIDVV